jgi:ABC-type polysaccharide/polyol phosphate transport system ATPase subunit
MFSELSERQLGTHVLMIPQSITRLTTNGRPKHPRASGRGYGRKSRRAIELDYTNRTVSSLDVAIRAINVTKSFRIYTERNQTLKQSILRRKRAQYREFKALDSVSFEIESGSTFGIIGSNGSGKSTTLKVLASILEPDSGVVDVQGRVSALLELGAGFHPELSGRENVFLNAAILGIPRREAQKRFDAIVEFAGIGEFIDSAVKNYSSGMYARLGFAVAVNVDPDVLLIDEVLAVGDEAFQRKCAERVDELRSEGRTVVIVSHGLGSLQSLCDAAIWIEKGHVQLQGRPDEVVGAYVRWANSQLDGQARQASASSGEAECSMSVDVRRTEIVAGGAVDLTIAWGPYPRDPRGHLVVGLRRSDGLLIGETTTAASRESGLDLSAAGRIGLRFDTGSLLSSNYEIEVTMESVSTGLPLGRVHQAGSVTLLPSRTGAFRGVIILDGVWSTP